MLKLVLFRFVLIDLRHPGIVDNLAPSVGSSVVLILMDTFGIWPTCHTNFVIDPAMKWARPEWPKDEAPRTDQGGLLARGFTPSPPARGSGGAL